MKEVLIYTTPFCPYCVMAKRLLTTKQVAFEEIDVSQDYSLRQTMMKRSGKRTVPQIFIGGVSIGGCDDLHALEQKGELDRMLSEKSS